MIKKDLAKDKRITKEVQRLRGIFGEIESDRSRTAESLIENAAFMRITLENLQAEINQNGVTEEYQNGANQSGVKRSAAVDVYNTMIKNYLQVMKQMSDLLPKGSLDSDDGFEEFANRRF